MLTSKKLRHAIATAALTVFAVADIAPALADPPPWAPAHGYRAKKEKKHKRDRDYDNEVAVYVLPPMIAGGVCNPSASTSRTVGLILGAAAGGYAGSRFGEGNGKLATTAFGVFVGGLIGRELGSMYSGPIGTCAGQALEFAPEGQVVSWHAPDNGVLYDFTPVRTFQDGGQYCREYQTKVVIGGRPQSAYGTACRQPDGDWVIVQ